MWEIWAHDGGSLLYYSNAGSKKAALKRARQLRGTAWFVLITRDGLPTDY